MSPVLVRPYVRVIAHHQIPPPTHLNNTPVVARPEPPEYHPRHSWMTFVNPASPPGPRSRRGVSPSRRSASALRRGVSPSRRGAALSRREAALSRREAALSRRGVSPSRRRVQFRRGARSRHYPAFAWTVLVLTLSMTGAALVAGDRAATSAPSGDPVVAAEAGRLQTALVPAPGEAGLAPGSAPAAAASVVVSGPLVGPSGLCLDARAGVQLRRCTGGESQAWTAPADGTLRTAGRCLQPVAGRLSLVRCTGAAAQQWDTAGGTLVARASKQCLTGRGDWLVLTRCGGGTSQRWQLP
ncbi:ricin-type beta-trefoil lectin domain protein [Dactylosporangium sp. NPDC005555]|uniref:ricin-type beta-trefoil lectin domain protein n=1 Tax=Dactylosporangium sp. NPDC005555 TaxID=3154889 RepID=UPI0033B8639D